MSYSPPPSKGRLSTRASSSSVMEQHGCAREPHHPTAAAFRRKNEVLNQIYANVLNKPISGTERRCDESGLRDFRLHGRGRGSSIEAAQNVQCADFAIVGSAHAATYQGLYRLYRKLYFSFGERRSLAAEIGEILPELRRIAARARGGKSAGSAASWKSWKLTEPVRRGLVIYTFGNASGVSREHGLVAIKPSGVPYDKMKPSDMVITGPPRGTGRKATCGHPPTWQRTWRFTALSRRSAAWCIRIPAMLLPGLRRAARFRALGLPMRTTSTARSR